MGDGNSYFDALRARPDYWKSYTLRDPRQLVPPAQGGLLYSDSLSNPWSYDATMDAARVQVPEFAGNATNSLSVSLSATSATATFNTAPGDYVPGASLRVDNEVIQLGDYINPATRTAPVVRGTRGTTATVHGAGARTYLSSNSVGNMVVLPLGTADGNTYFFTWDSYWTDSHRIERSGIDHWKAWQFENGGTWLEQRMRFGGGWGASKPSDYDARKHVASVDFRTYNEVGGVASWSATNGNTTGPIVRNTAPVEPMSPFAVQPNMWLRHFVLIEQRANDYDYVTAWVADETRGPIQILNRVPFSVRPFGRMPNSIGQFWLELDSSQDTILTREMGLQLVSFHRNFVALRNPTDTLALLVRPLPGATPPPPSPAPYPPPDQGPPPPPGPTPAPGTPSAPQNLRIVPPPPK